MKENKINICKAIGDCEVCPFQDECDISFKPWNSKEYWLSELKDKLSDLEYAIKKVEEYNE